MIRTLTAALATTTCLIALATPAAAQTREFNIPAGSLRAALDIFARQSGRQVIYRGDEVRSARSPGVRGVRTADEALDVLLAGTGFAVRKDASGAFAVIRVGNGRDAGTSASSSGGDADENAEIVVTGTNIQGVTPVGAPLRQINREEIARSGFITVEQLVQSIPENFKGGLAGASQDVNFSARSIGRNTYGTGVNLRGIGNNATLVLVNGHRVPPSGDGTFTDISTIPVFAIERVDVLTDGASAIYGSDAIAGVVNIILKPESDGLETGVRYGFADDFSTFGANAQLGRRWNGGGISVSADYSRQGRLDSSERSFTALVPSPTTILPSFNQVSLLGAFNQDIGTNLEVHADAQYSHTRRVAFTTGRTTLKRIPEVDRWSASGGLRWRISPGWTLRYDGTFGAEKRQNDLLNWVNGAVTSAVSEASTTAELIDQTASVSGSLFELSGGAVQLAVGGNYRSEKYKQLTRQASGNLRFDVDRDIASGYGEIRIPLVSNLNSAPGVRELTVSGAFRFDHYSDFGDTTNPKIGVIWSPIEGLRIRGAYSTSFRAPAAGSELVNSEQGTTGALVQATPAAGGSGRVPIVLITGAQPNLKPETAKNITVGFDYRPPFADGLNISINYYRISYKDQLADPPFSANPLNEPALAPVITKFANSADLRALVDAARAKGALYLDITGGLFGSDPLASAVYLYDFRTQNLSRTRTSGFDVNIDYSVLIGSDQIDVRLNGTYIDNFRTALTASSPEISQVNTVGFPARLRMRGQTSWTRGPMALSGALNYVNDYPDNSAPTPRRVASYITADLTARYEFPLNSPLHGFRLAASVANLFDRKPPYVVSGANSFANSHYDAANANPLGRLVSFQVSKSW